MLSVNISNNLHELLAKVNGHFEQNLKRDFINECIKKYEKCQENPNQKFDISSALIHDGNVNIKLNNLRITQESPCILNIFLLNLEMLNVGLEVNIKRLRINGEYRELTANTLEPILKSGKITFILYDTIFYINVGIAIEEDCFMTVNYDIKFKPEKISTEINIQNENYKTSSTDIDKTLFKYLTAQLKTFLHWEVLHEPLAFNIVKYSARELLLDEPTEIVALSAERALKANELMDSLLNSINEFFKSSNQTIMETPPIYTCILDGEIYKSFETNSGQLQDLSTLERCDDMSYYEHQGVQYLYGLLGLLNFKLKYTSCRIEQNLEDNGIIEVGIYRAEIFVKLALSKDEDSTNISVCKVHASDIIGIDFNIFNFNNLKNFSDQLKSLFVGSLYSIVLPSLEQKVLEGLVYAIQNKKI